MANAAFWKIKSPAGLNWHQWDDENLIYNVLPGTLI